MKFGSKENGIYISAEIRMIATAAWEAAMFEFNTTLIVWSPTAIATSDEDENVKTRNSAMQQ